MFPTIQNTKTKRKVFFSFNFKEDFWRTQQVRNIGSIERNKVVNANAWEEVKQKGDTAIKNWIDTNLNGKSCLVVLIGEKTAGRKWIKYEIEKAWNSGKGVLGIRIHKLENIDGMQAKAGNNPFETFTLCDETMHLSDVVEIKNPTGRTGKEAYKSIYDNIVNWIEAAIKIRNDFECPKKINKHS